MAKHEKIKVTPEHWFKAAAEGNINQLERWHKAGVLKHRFDPASVKASAGEGRPSFMRLINGNNEDALLCALRCKRLEYALRLIELERFPQNKQHFTSAFHLMADIKDPSLPYERLIELLKTNGHDINMVPAGKQMSSVSTNSGETALGHAISTNHEVLALLLIKHGADFKHRSSMQTPLVLAVKQACFPVVKCLLDHGVDPNEYSGSGKAKGTAISYVTVLWEKKDDDEGSSRRRILEVLLDAGGDPLLSLRDDDNSIVPRELMKYDTSKVIFDAEIANAETRRLEKSTQQAPQKIKRGHRL